MTRLLAACGALARGSALLGGALLCALIVLVVASVVGRALNTLGHAQWFETLVPGLATALLATGVGPIDGDFEMLEAGIAVVIFAALPLCQYVGGHARVDLVTQRLPATLERWLIAFWELVLAVAIVLIGLQLFRGLQGKLSNGETTFILQFPVWWGYAASFAACTVAMVLSVACAVARVLEAALGRAWLPDSVDAR